MGAAQTGNSAAYTRLLSEVDLWLQAYFRRRLPADLVNDATQDTLLAIHEKRHTYDPQKAFGPWLAAIARYKWIDRLRAMGRDLTEPLSDYVAAPDQEEAHLSALTLEDLMRDVKPAQAAAIGMVKLEGYSVEETANRTGQSASLVKINIHRGLARLMARVRDRSDDT
ncbi:sigma-70 family RNA polymerase sigma factor [Gluconobacter cerinus]|jgi:RNA polymerase sigma-70 factor (ECF subfamily)|nr:MULTISPECIES: sigma-70 family RNA polymerase sigma factor [Gluconobacter]MBS1039092.1 sigma-70 family RNA polymerase sigma factor [Gluconobacter cerinus]MBS1063962.1 sigma-70 family RNA polymerase sigma factor [Gluconobacter wancherniae]MBS1072738.1 sigma-70 family RNA polymerase sigma factor [Gluconobacter cerinus]MBS1089942.1 sigma-70 family RNA polymerase sigma factor [Gluconobacter wancherniae]